MSLLARLTLLAALGAFVLGSSSVAWAQSEPSAVPQVAPVAPQAAPAPPPAMAADNQPVMAQQAAQAKLMAYRAARVDGIRKLSERIKGLNITSTTSVRDFVAESDQIQSALDAFIKGVKEVGQPRYFRDGTCEVDMEVPLSTVITELKTIHDECYKGSRVKISDFEQMTVTNKITMIRETGNSVVRADAPMAEGGAPAVIPAPGIPAIWMQYCKPQGRLMAVRAARVDAMRKLAERIKGLRITSTTNVRDFVAENDQIQTELDAFIKGIRESGEPIYHADELIVDVPIEVTLRTVYQELKSLHERYYKGNHVTASDFDQVINTVQDTKIREIGNGVPPERYLNGQPGAAPPPAAMQSSGLPRPNWPGVVRATGQAVVDAKNPNAAQARLMAQRGAEVEARRKLAEQLSGLSITSNTNVHDFSAINDDIAADLQTFQQGAHVVDSKINDDGTAETTVEIPTDSLWRIVTFWQQKVTIR